MTVVEKNFSVFYEVGKRCLIRTTGAGVLDNGTAYNSSVKLSSQNIFKQVNNKTMFEDTKDVVAVFRFYTNSDLESYNLAKAIEEYLQKNDKLKLFGSLPSYVNNEYLINVDYKYEDFLKEIQKDKK